MKKDKDMDWELLAKIFAGLFVCLLAYLYDSNQRRNETQIAELKKEVAELKSGFPLARE